MTIFFRDKDHYKGLIKHPGLASLMEHSSAKAEEAKCIIDLEPTKENLLKYWHSDVLLIIGVVENSLSQWAATLGKPSCQLIGINQIPFFLNKPAIECTSLDFSHRTLAADFFSTFNIPILWSQDSPGMVSARVVCMIINEACFLIGEGTANEEDLNVAMKLGVNYPGGPMEWLHEIGVQRVTDILSALFSYYQSEKYRLAPYLHRIYLHQKMLNLN